MNNFEYNFYTLYDIIRNILLLITRQIETFEIQGLWCFFARIIFGGREADHHGRPWTYLDTPVKIINNTVIDRY